jgi:hypothetical protein
MSRAARVAATRLVSVLGGDWRGPNRTFKEFPLAAMMASRAWSSHHEDHELL